MWVLKEDGKVVFDLSVRWGEVMGVYLLFSGGMRVVGSGID